MGKRGASRRYEYLLDSPEISAWYNNLARRNKTTADVYLRRLARVVLGALGKSPVDLLALEQSALEDAVSACIDHEFSRGMLGSTVKGFHKALVSFLAWHGRKILRDNTIPGAESYPNAESEVIPDQDALRRVLQVSQPRTAAMLAVLAQGGVRLQVLGTIDASLGLRLGDFVEATVTGEGLVFDVVPTRVEVDRGLSKHGQPFFFFLGEEACELIQAYLRVRVQGGEVLEPDSPLFRPFGGKARFMLRNNIGDSIRRAMRQAGVGGRPYVWRSYYANRCQLAESKGFLEAWRKFCMGHTGNIQTRYAMRKGALPDDSVDRMREAYGGALPFLEAHVQEQEDPTPRFAAMILQAAGMGEDEVGALDLDAMNQTEIATLLQDAFDRQRSEAAVLSTEVRQRILPIAELDQALQNGWLFKAALGNEQVVVEQNG